MAVNLQLTLHPDRVAAPVLMALRDTLEVISICFPAIENATSIPPLDSKGMDFRIEPKQAARVEQRRPIYKQWLLSKGFHELTKGLRRSLEEAYFYLQVSKIGGKIVTWGEFQSNMNAFRKKANGADFPALMGWVNEDLSKKLHFEREFHSLIKIRNCLEHRYGIVGDRDVDKATGMLLLSLPRLKIYFMRDGVETEVVIGQVVEKDTEIMMKQVTADVSYKLGDKISFTVDEFKGIAFACWAFSQDLVGKLPQLSQNKGMA